MSQWNFLFSGGLSASTRCTTSQVALSVLGTIFQAQGSLHLCIAAGIGRAFYGLERFVPAYLFRIGEFNHFHLYNFGFDWLIVHLHSFVKTLARSAQFLFGFLQFTCVISQLAVGGVVLVSSLIFTHRDPSRCCKLSYNV